ncbi:MAG: hypothetical protein HY586_06570, partial [Candidatus Omnitrophica bacterium]|nr:hypothetical protein [Candidatus Omnitrophota bacterium]
SFSEVDNDPALTALRIQVAGQIRGTLADLHAYLDAKLRDVDQLLSFPRKRESSDFHVEDLLEDASWGDEDLADAVRAVKAEFAGEEAESDAQLKTQLQKIVDEAAQTTQEALARVGLSPPRKRGASDLDSGVTEKSLDPRFRGGDKTQPDGDQALMAQLQAILANTASDVASQLAAIRVRRPSGDGKSLGALTAEYDALLDAIQASVETKKHAALLLIETHAQQSEWDGAKSKSFRDTLIQGFDAIEQSIEARRRELHREVIESKIEKLETKLAELVARKKSLDPRLRGDDKTPVARARTPEMQKHFEGRHQQLVAALDAQITLLHENITQVRALLGIPVETKEARKRKLIEDRRTFSARLERTKARAEARVLEGQRVKKRVAEELQVSRRDVQQRLVNVLASAPQALLGVVAAQAVKKGQSPEGTVPEPRVEFARALQDVLDELDRAQLEFTARLDLETRKLFLAESEEELQSQSLDRVSDKLRMSALTIVPQSLRTAISENEKFLEKVRAVESELREREVVFELNKGSNLMFLQEERASAQEALTRLTYDVESDTSDWDKGAQRLHNDLQALTYDGARREFNRLKAKIDLIIKNHAKRLNYLKLQFDVLHASPEVKAEFRGHEARIEALFKGDAESSWPSQFMLKALQKEIDSVHQPKKEALLGAQKGYARAVKNWLEGTNRRIHSIRAAELGAEDGYEDNQLGNILNVTIIKNGASQELSVLAILDEADALLRPNGRSQYAAILGEELVRENIDFR